MISSVILGTGSNLPGDSVPNSSFTQFPAQMLSLIEEKTGIYRRHYVAKNQSTSDLALAAIDACLNSTCIDRTDIDALIVATSSPDYIHPPTAAVVQGKAGLINAFAFDINSVCSGAIYALQMADSLIKSNFCKRVMVVAAEAYSRFLDCNAINVYPYFGDGAGAVLLEGGSAIGSRRRSGILHALLGTDGTKFETIIIPAGGARLPGPQCTNQSDFYFRMKGRDVFNFAIAKGSQIILQCLEEANVNLQEIDCVITHQANINIIDGISKRTNISREKFFVNLNKYGNTAAASVLIALDEAFQTKKIGSGALVILVTFGGGLSWGAMLVRC